MDWNLLGIRFSQKKVIRTDDWVVKGLMIFKLGKKKLSILANSGTYFSKGFSRKILYNK